MKTLGQQSLETARHAATKHIEENSLTFEKSMLKSELLAAVREQLLRATVEAGRTAKPIEQTEAASAVSMSLVGIKAAKQVGYKTT